MHELKEPLKLKDYLEKELFVGDKVIFIRDWNSSSALEVGTVVGETKTMVILDSTRKAPHKLVKI